MDAPTFHIAMYPWFAIGHLKVYLHLSNKLAQKGHKISFIAPTKTVLHKMQPFNFHQDLITFVPITVPDVDGLPPGSETTADVPFSMGTLLATAMDRTQETIEDLLRELKVDAVFFDLAHWMPRVAKQLGIKSIFYDVVGTVPMSFGLSLLRTLGRDLSGLTPDLLIHKLPKCFPGSTIKFHPHEARGLFAHGAMEYGDKLSMFERILTGLSQSDKIAFRACREIDGAYCDYVEAHFGKSILLSGPVIPEAPASQLEEKWDEWLSKFRGTRSVVYCAFGSECIFKMDQFQELLLGLELTGLPFLAVLKPPVGVESVDAALPKDFKERTKERGIVYGGWVQQQLILEHSVVGCFITHFGSNSFLESLPSKCQLVMLPDKGEQIIYAKLMAGHLKVGVEVEKGVEDGLFTREPVSEAVRLVMDEDSEVGKEVRANLTRIRETLLNKDLESSYIDSFNNKLIDLIG